MNFFGIGPMELVFILILALIIFGPGRLPEIGRAVGKSIRDFQAMTQEMSQQFSLDLEEAAEPKKEKPQKTSDGPPTAGGSGEGEQSEPPAAEPASEAAAGEETSPPAAEPAPEAAAGEEEKETPQPTRDEPTEGEEQRPQPVGEASSSSKTEEKSRPADG